MQENKLSHNQRAEPVGNDLTRSRLTINNEPAIRTPRVQIKKLLMSGFQVDREHLIELANRTGESFFTMLSEILGDKDRAERSVYTALDVIEHLRPRRGLVEDALQKITEEYSYTTEWHTLIPSHRHYDVGREQATRLALYVKAIDTLGTLEGDATPKMLPLLMQVISQAIANDELWWCGRAALQLLATYKDRASSALPLVMQMMHSPCHYLRQSAVSALIEIAQPDDVMPRLIALFNDPRGPAQSAAEKAIGAFGPSAIAASSAIQERLIRERSTAWQLADLLRKVDPITYQSMMQIPEIRTKVMNDRKRLDQFGVAMSTLGDAIDAHIDDYTFYDDRL